MSAWCSVRVARLAGARQWFRGSSLPVSGAKAGARSCTSLSGTATRTLQYDLCIIGGGSAGIAGAVRAWDLGKKVCVIEANEGLGGAVVWAGGQVCKTLAQIACEERQTRALIQGGESKCKVSGRGSFMSLEMAKDMAGRASAERAMQLDQLVIALGQTRKFNRPSLKRADTSGTIERFRGKANFIEPYSVSVSPVNQEEGGCSDQLVVSADNFLICTGARYESLAKFDLDGQFIISPSALLELETWPKSVLILGARANGCEVATVLSAFGGDDIDIHLVNDGKDRLFEEEDEDLSWFAQLSLERSGVKVYHSTVLEYARVDEDKGKVECRLVITSRLPPHPDDPEQRRPIKRVMKTLNVEKLVVSVGRSPNTRNLGLDVPGVQVDERGAIMVDDNLRSVSAPHVLAAGEAVGRIGLVNVAETEARYAMEQLYDTEQAQRIDYNAVASSIFLQTQISCVGMCEAEARRRGVPYMVARVGLELIQPFLARHYAWKDRPKQDGMEADGLDVDEVIGDDAEDDGVPPGFVKILVSHDEEKRLLGVRVCGAPANSILQTASVMIHDRVHISHLAYSLYAHPGIAEAMLECARMVLGTNLYKVHAFPDSCYIHSWAPTTSNPAPAKEDAEYKPGYRSCVPGYLE